MKLSNLQPLYSALVDSLASSAFLVVKLADLGDVLTATPAIRALRRTYPSARIELLTSTVGAAALSGWEAVDDITTFDKAAFDHPWQAALAWPRAVGLFRRLRGRFDCLVLLHHLTTWWGTLKYAFLATAVGAHVRAGLDNGRGAFLTHGVDDFGFGARHEADYCLAVVGALGAQALQPRLELPVRAAASAWADRRWSELGLDGRPVALVHPGSGGFSLARRWPAERFARVGDQIADQLGLDVVVLAGPGPGEDDLAAQVVSQMSRPASILGAVPSAQELAAVLTRCSLFVANDSGVSHTAFAVGTPSVVLFGPSNDRAWGPYPPGDPRYAVLAEPLACRPCVYVGHRLGTPKGCAARTCLDLIQPSRVIEAAREVLATNGA